MTTEIESGRYNLSVPVSQYKDDNGNTKTQWHTVGVLRVSEDGKMKVKINSLPISVSQVGTGEQVPWEGWLQVFHDDGGTYVAGGTRQRQEPPLTPSPEHTAGPEEDPF